MKSLIHRHGRTSSRNGILEASIELIGSRGLKASSLDLIAKTAGVSRPLVTHYFKSKDEIFKAATLLVSSRAQIYVQNRMMKTEPDPWESLVTYLKANFDWAKRHPNDLKFWITFGLRCSWDQEARELNKKIRSKGRNTIRVLVTTGIKIGRFQSDLGLPTLSRILSDGLYASILKLATEDKIENASQSTKELIELARILLNPRVQSI